MPKSQHRLFTPRRPWPTFHCGVTCSLEELIEKWKKKEVILSIPQWVYNPALKIEPAAADWHPCHMFRLTRRFLGAKQLRDWQESNITARHFYYLKTEEVAKNTPKNRNTLGDGRTIEGTTLSSRHIMGLVLDVCSAAVSTVQNQSFEPRRRPGSCVQTLETTLTDGGSK